MYLYFAVKYIETIQMGQYKEQLLETEINVKNQSIY